MLIPTVYGNMTFGHTLGLEGAFCQNGQKINIFFKLRKSPQNCIFSHQKECWSRAGPGQPAGFFYGREKSGPGWPRAEGYRPGPARGLFRFFHYFRGAHQFFAIFSIALKRSQLFFP
jgi:hypothetical protein